MVGWSSLLRGRTADTSLRKGLDIIHRNAVAQGRIVEDILDVSRIITGKLRLELAPAELATIVRDAIDVVRPAALAREIAIELVAPEDTYRLIADADRLQQVVWNLLSNAVKFGKKRGTIRVSIEHVDSSYALTVADDGQGIAPEFLPFVFDRFKQADSSATRRIGGLGLGLALVRHLVELHGGKVRAESPGPGQGTSFTITLPVRALLASHPSARGREHQQTDEVAAYAPTAALSGVRVLVVDDDEDARELVGTVLETAGAEVKTAGSTAEGLVTFYQFRPHLLVSDIGMPEEDGYTFMRRIRALDSAEGGNVPALALTAYARKQDRAAAVGAGFTRHIGKPVEPGALLEVVMELAQTVTPLPEMNASPKP
jgi:CheY-like chemotaxis protein/anti-sigma regulatory factor (Ser/Thr protein kinase)